MANLQRIEELTNIVQDKPKWLEPFKQDKLPPNLDLSGQIRWLAEGHYAAELKYDFLFRSSRSIR